MTKEQFKNAAGISDSMAEKWYNPIYNAMNEFGIIENIDKAMFIAQVGHESGGFASIIESLNYSVQGLKLTFPKRISDYQAEILGRKPGQAANQQAIANLVYGGRLGNKGSGDGWKYKGRGLIQITGLDNYRAFGTALKLDLIANPSLLESEKEAARSAAWFYVSKGCLKYPGDLVRVTQIINGGQNGFNDRKDRFNKARSVLV